MIRRSSFPTSARLWTRWADTAQYSALVAAVIGSAVVPTIIANAFFFPHHHLAPAKRDGPGVATKVEADASSQTSEVLR